MSGKGYIIFIIIEYIKTYNTFFNVYYMTYKLFTFGEILKDVHFKDLEYREIEEITPEDIPFLIKTGKIKSADDGGAPANVAAYMALLGGRATFLGCTGNDAWGRELNKNFKKYGVNIVSSDGEGKFTDAALVYTDAKGKHQFVKFLWGSLPLLESNKIERLVQDCDIIHIGSITSSAFKGSREIVERVIGFAESYRRPITLDANVREGIYNSRENVRDQITYLMRKSKITKISGVELFFLTNGVFEGNVDYEGFLRIINKIGEQYKDRILITTLGEAGAIAHINGETTWSSSYDFQGRGNTIGAGDSFCAAMIKKACELEIFSGDFSRQKLEDLLNYSCRVAGISVIENKTIVEKVKEESRLKGKRRYKTEEEFIRAVNQELGRGYEEYRNLI
jgi:fructokinase